MVSNENLFLEICRVARATHFPVEVAQQGDKVHLTHRDAQFFATMSTMHAFPEDLTHGESPFSIISVTYLTLQVVLFLHGDTPHDLTTATARLLSLVVSLPLMEANKLQPCRWCALPIPNPSTGGISQSQAECPTCQVMASYESNYTSAMLSTDGTKLDANLGDL